MQQLNSIVGKYWFYSSNIDVTHKDVIYKSVKKYEPKLIMLLAISPFFASSR